MRAESPTMPMPAGSPGTMVDRDVLRSKTERVLHHDLGDLEAFVAAMRDS